MSAPLALHQPTRTRCNNLLRTSPHQTESLPVQRSINSSILSKYVALTPLTTQDTACHNMRFAYMFEQCFKEGVRLVVGSEFHKQLSRAYSYLWWQWYIKAVILFISGTKIIAMRVLVSRKISFDDSQNGDLSPNKIGQSPPGGFTPLILQTYHNLQFQYLALAQILGKPHSLRTNNDLKFIVQFIKKSSALKELTQMLGSDFGRGIMRTASLEQLKVNQIVESIGSPVDRLYILLEGKLATIKNDNQSDMLSALPAKEVFDTLTGLARRQKKKMKRLKRKMSSLFAHEEWHHSVYKGSQEPQFLEYFQRQGTFGDKARCVSANHTHTSITVEPSVMLVIDFDSVLYWLDVCFVRKMEKSFVLLRNLSCFSKLSDEVLEGIIQFLSVLKVRKGDVIYRQGAQATHIYFLQEGQVKIEKSSHLFVENPNQLYVDRRKLMSERELSNHQFLQFADLHLLYNYKPTNKTLDLGIITPFCLFGEEEIIEARQRSTTTRCSSLKGTIFSIELKKLYQLLGQTTDNFLKGVKESMRQKVRYRQSAFATTINIQNRSNLKYFYEGESPTHRKDLVSKINSKLSSLVSPKTSRSAISTEPDPNQVHKSQVHQQAIPPSFNSFNFHHMLRTRLKNIKLMSQSSQEKEESILAPPGDRIQEEARERKIVNNSHTWRMVRDKVQKQFQMGRKIGSLSHKVNFNSPLIDEKYFRENQDEMRRLQREKRAGRTEFKIRSRSLVSSRRNTNRNR